MLTLMLMLATPAYTVPPGLAGVAGLQGCWRVSGKVQGKDSPSIARGEWHLGQRYFTLHLRAMGSDPYEAAITYGAGEQPRAIGSVFWTLSAALRTLAGSRRAGTRRLRATLPLLGRNVSQSFQPPGMVALDHYRAAQGQAAVSVETITSAQPMRGMRFDYCGRLGGGGRSVRLAHWSRATKYVGLQRSVHFLITLDHAAEAQTNNDIRPDFQSLGSRNTSRAIISGKASRAISLPPSFVTRDRAGRLSSFMCVSTAGHANAVNAHRTAARDPSRA